jgi:predicted Zn-dependent peptidase
MKRRTIVLLALLAAALGSACGPRPPRPEPATRPAPSASAPVASPSDTRPALSPPVPFRAAEPRIYTTASGLTVWLIERRGAALVTMCMVVPTGSAADPEGKPGLAHITAAMLDEGAGSRDAIALSAAFTDMGTSLRTMVSLDGTMLGLTVLRRYFDQAFALLGDVVSRPRFEPKEWTRVSALWKNELRQRADEPETVADIVSRAVLYGPDTPYGHPGKGVLGNAETMKLGDVRTFYRTAWRPDQGLLVIAGDVSKAELDGAIARALDGWNKPSTPPPAPPASLRPRDARPKLVVVDRPDAPQAVITVIRPGVAASDQAAPVLELLNHALGGSFTSRLNQNLRENHGWTYGAGSAMVPARGIGPFVASSAVVTEATGAALKEMLGEIARMAATGLTDEEYTKGRARDLTALMETNETVDGLAWRLGSLGVLGLPPNFDAIASQRRQAATQPELGALAKTYLATSDMSVIVVGPRAQLDEQLKPFGFGPAEAWGPDARPLPKR